MEFDLSKVYTVFNADEVKVGSKGYVADFKEDFINRIRSEDEEYYLSIKKIKAIDDYSFETYNGSLYRYFYLVEEPKKRPCTREELIEMLKKQGVSMLKCNLNGIDYMVEKIADGNCYVYDCGNHTYQELCKNYTLLDGTPLWVEE